MGHGEVLGRSTRASDAEDGKENILQAKPPKPRSPAPAAAKPIEVIQWCYTSCSQTVQRFTGMLTSGAAALGGLRLYFITIPQVKCAPDPNMEQGQHHEHPGAAESWQ